MSPTRPGDHPAATLPLASPQSPVRVADTQKQRIGAPEQEHAGRRSYLRGAADVVVAPDIFRSILPATTCGGDETSTRTVSGPSADRQFRYRELRNVSARGSLRINVGG